MSSSQGKAFHGQPAAASQPGSLAGGPAISRQPAGGRISPTVARMEPWVCWSIAACTAWIALVSFPDVPVLWLFVLYAGVLGQWCRLFPARHPARMFVHGALLLCAAYLLHSHAGDRLGGPGGLFFFWTAVPALAYALMLRPRWGMAVVALALVEFAASSAVRGDAGAPAVAQAGFLLLFPLALAMPFGEAMRRPDEQLEQSRIDGATGLLNRQGLMIHGDVLLGECRHDRHPPAMAVFGCDDLLAIRDMFGRRAGRKALDLLVAKLQAVAGSRGLAARTGPAEFTLMLPATSREKALQAIARQFGNPMRIEFDAGGEEVVMAPVLAVEAVGTGETTIESTHADLCADLAVRQDSAPGGAAAAGKPLPPETRLSPDSATVVVPGNLPDGAFVSHLPDTLPIALGAR